MAEKEKKTVKRTPAKKKTTKPVVKKTVDAQVEASPIEERVKGLSPISTLFSESWNLFKRTWVMYFKIAGVGIGLSLAAVAIGASISVPLFFTSGGNVDQLFMRPTSVQVALLVLLAVWVLALIGAIIIFEIIASIAFLLYINDPDRSWSLRELFVQSRPYFWKYFVSSLLVGVAVLGGMVFLFIPGLIISIFFSFVSMEIVLENKPVMGALQRSYQIVKEQFWAIVGRLVLIQIISFFLSQFLSSMREDNPFASMVIIIYSVFMGAFMLVYTFVVYNQAKSVVPSEKHVSIKWIWIITILGWACLLGLFGLALVSGIPQPPIKNV